MMKSTVMVVFTHALCTDGIKVTKEQTETVMHITLISAAALDAFIQQAVFIHEELQGD